MSSLEDLFDENMVSEIENWEPSDKDLSDIGQLASKLIECQNEVKQQEEQLALAKSRLKEVQEEALPAAMEKTGLSEIKLATGEKLSIDRYYGASIPAENKEQAFEWLRDTGNGDIIKHTVGVDFKKGEGESAERAYELLRSAGFEAKDEEKIAPPTLKAFVRVEVEEGRTFPPHFNVFIGQRAKIKR